MTTSIACPIMGGYHCSLGTRYEIGDIRVSINIKSCCLLLDRVLGVWKMFPNTFAMSEQSITLSLNCLHSIYADCHDATDGAVTVAGKLEFYNHKNDAHFGLTSKAYLAHSRKLQSQVLPSSQFNGFYLMWEFRNCLNFPERRIYGFWQKEPLPPKPL